jgi:hypothetical protein
MRFKLQFPIAGALLVLLGVALACGGPLPVGGPTPTLEPVPVSSEAAQSLVDKFNSLGVASGEVTVAITESELTSYVEQQLQAQPDSPFSDPQIYLRDGKINLYVTVTTSNLKANAQIVMNATVENNQMKVTVDRASLGPVPVPEDVLNSLTSTLNDKMLALASDLPSGVGLKAIAIADGLMTITAIVK